MSYVVRTGKAVLAAVAAGGLLTGTSVAALAQEPDHPAAAETTPARPRLGLTAGVGGIHGWLGAHAEYFFRGGRLSAGAGAGQVSRGIDDSDERVRTWAFAATIRGYLTAGKHRPFLEGSYSLLRLEWERGGTGAVDLDRYYGPGLALGYRYTATGGFTVTTAVGAGWAVGADRLVDTFHLGLGYTWRR
jgi:hypothetical protein